MNNFKHRSNFYRDCGQLSHEIISIGADMREGNWLTALENFNYNPYEKTIWIVEGQIKHDEK